MRASRLGLGLLLLAGMVGCSDLVQPRPPVAPTQKNLAANSSSKTYIVVFRSSVQNSHALAAQLVAQQQGLLGFVYERALRGFSARLPQTAVAALRNNPQVLFVEEDKPVRADTTEALCGFPACGGSGLWGLELVDQHTAPLPFGPWQYGWVHNGSTVRAYIIDSGLDSTQSDFGGRAKNVFDAFGGSGQDCYGHGTHVGGIVGSHTWGVAKGVTLRGVRVLDCSGNGTDATVIAGLDFVISDHQNNGALLPLTPAVANMSLDGGPSAALDSAVRNTIAAGVFVAVAAGNFNDNACNYSPADVTEAVTVAAIQINSLGLVQRAGYSDFGSCVDIYGPGTTITSTKLGGGSVNMTGTSMATPFVTGAAAVYKNAMGDADEGTIAAWLVTNGTTGLVQNNPAGTPNLIVFKSPTF